MDTSRAGYATPRQNRFTWRGALRPLRNARFTLCRRFRPSPCPSCRSSGAWEVLRPLSADPQKFTTRQELVAKMHGLHWARYHRGRWTRVVARGPRPTELRRDCPELCTLAHSRFGKI